MSLWSIYSSYSSKKAHKWSQFIPAYENHFAQYINKPITVFEVGVWKGGSLEIWKKFLGPNTTIVGFDIDENCLHHKKPELDIHVEIGGQSDTKFLTRMIEKYGNPDIVIDDGSHHMNDIIATFEFLYPIVEKNGMYVVEDTHTSYLENYVGKDRKKNRNWMEIAKELVDKLHAESPGQYNGMWNFPWHSLPQSNEFANSTLSMHFYDSIVFFQKGKVKNRLIESGVL